nr:carboxypeptidase regulatory-like domain-containing protein [Bryobacter sp.]
GVKLPVQTRLNALARVTTAENGLPTFLQRPSQADLDRLTLTLPQIQARPFFVPSYENAGFESFVTAFMPWGNSVYHGLQTQLTKRFAQGFSTQVAYTWSKNIDDSTAALFSTLISPRRPQDFQNWQPERSRSALDRTHRFTVTGLWEVPWFKASDNWFAKNVAGNWTFGGTYTKESAMYGTVQSGIDSNLNFDGAPDRAIINPAGTDGVGSGVTALTNSRNQVVGYLANNPNARYIVAGSGVFANGGRNTLKLRGINNIDFSVMKNFQLGKGDRAPMFQFRAEMYNAMNHSQFTPGSINTIAAVSRTDTRNYLIPSHPNFNNPETAFGNNPRVIQLVGRIQW